MCDTNFEQQVFAQQQFNLRYPTVAEALVTRGCHFDSKISAFVLDNVRVYPEEANLTLQRHLNIRSQAYLKFIIKTENTVAQTIYDDLTLVVTDTIEKLLSTLNATHAATKHIS